MMSARFPPAWRVMTAALVIGAAAALACFGHRAFSDGSPVISRFPFPII